MNYDIPKDFKIEIAVYASPIKQESKIAIPLGATPEPIDMGGYLTISGAGTANSSATEARMQPIYCFIPREGPIPSAELDLEQFRKVLEEITYPKPKK